MGGKIMFLFGSELKALRCHPNFQREINSDSLANYLRLVICLPRNQYLSNIYKLTPGCFLEINNSDSNNQLLPETYWSFPKIVKQAQLEPLKVVKQRP